MEIKTIKNFSIHGAEHQICLTDYLYLPDGKPKPIVFFCHGFKGFKDWGCFNNLATEFAENGFVFVKFNFSHNGTTIDKPSDFADLEAFSKNTFSKELKDLNSVINETLELDILENEIDNSQIYLLGHSRGGSIALIEGMRNNKVKKIGTLAAVTDLPSRWPEDKMEDWKKNGIRYIKNARTGQDMPMKYDIVEDYYKNEDDYNILDNISNLKKPCLIIHGSEDEAVGREQAIELKRAKPEISMELIPGAGHTFGCKHPSFEDSLPYEMQLASNKLISFFKQ